MGNPFISERGPKVRVVASPSTWMEGEALRQLDATAELPGMRLCAGMPDLHPGKGGPVGGAFLSEGVIHPLLVGNDVGCGISLWRTDMPIRKARPDRLAARMEGLDLPWEGDTADWLSAYGLEPGEFDRSLGTVGAGNHFMEIQAVHEVRDPEAFAALGLDRDRACVLVHSGSRGLGEAVLRAHAAERGASPLPVDEAGGYLAAHGRAVRWAEANRDLCARRACEAVGCEAVRVLDVCHNSVVPYDLGGCGCWLHRKGAAPADAGPVVIPGSRGDLSALVLPDAGTDAALRSLAHGAGRKLARHEAKAKLRGLHRRSDLRENPWGGRVVCGQEALLWEEAPEAYKPLDRVIGDLEGAGLLRVVAFLRPIVTFKASEGARDEAKAARSDRFRERREARDAKDRGRWK